MPSLCILAALLLTSCPGNGELDSSDGETYGGSGSSSTSASSGSSGSGGSYTANFSFDEFMRLTDAGDTDALEAMFRDDSVSSGGGGSTEGGEYGEDPLVLSADDLGVPEGGTVTLSITGGVEDYEETATAEDDGKVYFFVPRQRVGSTITISLVVKSAAGMKICWGKKTQLVKAGCQFSISLKRPPEGFVFVAGNGTVGDLYVCTHEVTQGEYETYCSYDSYDRPTSDWGLGSNVAAYYISWFDALVYCNLRSMAEGLTPCYKIGGSTDPADWSGIVTGTGGKYRGPDSYSSTWNNASYSTTANGYRLPTEAEWEYAARGGPANDSYTYSGSNSASRVAWYSGISGKVTAVKRKDPNSLGLYDMSGNVAEWCWDYYSTSPGTRVLRGGGWSSESSDCTVSSRSSYTTYYRFSTANGFRVVRKAD